MASISQERLLSRSNLWIALMAAVTLGGFTAIVVGFVIGHHATFNTSTGVPWGILISTYLFFVLPASGLCLLSSLGHIFGIDRFKPIGHRAILIAITLMLSGFLVIASDLESPWRMAMYLFVTPNPTSPMWWMGCLYAVYLILLILEFIFLCRAEAIRRLQASPGSTKLLYRILAIWSNPDMEYFLQHSKKVAKISGTAAVFFAIAALSMLGAVFGFTSSRTIWHGPFLPVYFILSASVAGSSILTLFLVLKHRSKGQEPAPEIAGVTQTLSKLILLLIGIYLVFTVWNILAAQYGLIPESYNSVKVLVNGPLAVSFWAGEIIIGLIIPIAILAYTRGKRTWGLIVAPLLIFVGTFFARYNLVIAGQLSPIVGQDELWHYFPHIIEILTVVAAVGMWLLLYSLGSRLLPLEDNAPVSGQEEGANPPLVPTETATDAPEIG
ncbi:MAG: polysulfide reductase NrfD [Dehalococcoidales bacterium]|nr:MAG: polysulfide reductase NrfD [Dehalococcoidales bacterium]